MFQDQIQMQCIFIQVNIIALSYAKHFYPVIKAFLENININNFSPLQLPRFKCKEQELLPFSQYFLFIIMRQVHHKSNRYKLFSGMTDHFPRRLVYVHISRSLSFFTRVSGHINLHQHLPTLSEATHRWNTCNIRGL